MEQKLQIIAEKLQTPCLDLSLLQGRIGIILFFFHYAKFSDRVHGEKYANKLLSEVIEDIQKISYSGQNNILADVGAGIEYLVQQQFVRGNTNVILEDFDEHINRIVFYSSKHSKVLKDITCYGKYYAARLNNPNNRMKTNSSIEPIKKNLSLIISSLPCFTIEDIFSIIHFLPNVINLDIERKKTYHYLNYAVDRLETVVYENVFFGNYPENFNPIVAAVLLFRAASKNNNDDYIARALHFLDKYESDFRQYLSGEQAIKWSFLYHILWKSCNRDIYQRLSIQWFENCELEKMDLNFESLIKAGMMLLTMNESINDDWLDLFPLY